MFKPAGPAGPNTQRDAHEAVHEAGGVTADLWDALPGLAVHQANAW